MTVAPLISSDSLFNFLLVSPFPPSFLYIPYYATYVHILFSYFFFHRCHYTTFRVRSSSSSVCLFNFLGFFSLLPCHPVLELLFSSTWLCPVPHLNLLNIITQWSNPWQGVGNIISRRSIETDSQSIRNCAHTAHCAILFVKNIQTKRGKAQKESDAAHKDGEHQSQPCSHDLFFSIS